MKATPRTDAAKRVVAGMADEWVPRYISEELEREINELLEKNEMIEIRHAAVMIHTQNVVDEANKANEILKATLRALPVGYIPAHTFESIPERVRDVVEQLAESSQREESLAEYADELAAGLPVGMLPKDVENLRHANGIFAQQVFDLEQQMTKAWHILSALSSNSLDDGPTWSRALEWLDKNDDFRTKNKLI
jgi:uncharacterized protein (UPF0147 family)